MTVYLAGYAGFKADYQNPGTRSNYWQRTRRDETGATCQRRKGRKLANKTKDGDFDRGVGARLATAEIFILKNSNMCLP